MRGIVASKLPYQSESRKASATVCKYLTFTTVMPTTFLASSRQKKQHYYQPTLKGIVMEGSNVYKESSVDPDLNGSGGHKMPAENTQPCCCTVSSLQMAVLSLRALHNTLQYDTRSFREQCIGYLESIFEDSV